MSKKLLLMITILTMGSLSCMQAQNDVEVHLKGDLVTNYIWRGLNLGFVIVFNYVNWQHYCQLNFGTSGNTQHAIEQISGDIRTKTATRPGSVDSGRWYDVRLTVAGDSVKAWLDDMPVFDDVLRLK